MARRFGFDLLKSQIADFQAAEIESWVDECRPWVSGDTEIEKLFVAAMLAYEKWGDPSIDLRLPRTEEDERKYFDDAAKRHIIVMRPQAQVGEWRVDFLIHAFAWKRDGTPDRWRKLIVECDGHDFHERTKEQAAKDRGRDRLVQMDGIEIFRFTGSELWRDPWGCAKQVYDWIDLGH